MKNTRPGATRKEQSEEAKLSADQPAPIPSMTTFILGGGAAGLCWGIADAMAVSAADSLPSNKGIELLLICAEGAVIATIATLFMAIVWSCTGPLRPRICGNWEDTRWHGFCWGIVACGLLDFGERWFTKPPPFTEVSNQHGNPLVYGLIALAAIVITGVFLQILRKGRPRAVFALVVVSLLCLRAKMADRVLPRRGDAPPDAPNVLMVTLDTTRADHMGWPPNDVVKTPHFHELAAGGVGFTNAFSQIAVTGPSHLTIMGGQGTWAHGNLLNGIPIPTDIVLLPEALRTAGYRTGGFVSAYVLDGSLGFSRGFDVYDDDFGWLGGWGETLAGRLWAAVSRHIDPNAVLERRGESTVDEALSWLTTIAPPQKTEADRYRPPFFAWVHLFDPHGPYEPPEPYASAYYTGDPRDPSHTSMEQVQGVAPYLKSSLEGITDVDWVLAQYAGEVEYTDAQLGRLLNWLDAAGHAENTLVIVAGDHGESLGEHDVWFNHGADLFESATRVPLAIRLPGRVPAGKLVESPVELTDLARTTYELLQIDLPATVHGRSLLSVMNEGPGEAFARAFCFDRDANVAARERGEIEQPKYRMAALRGASSRYVLREAPRYGPAYFEVEQRERGGLGGNQPREILVDGDPELLGMLEQQAQALMAAMSQEDVERSGTELDEATREKLEMLGYME